MSCLLEAIACFSSDEAGRLSILGQRALLLVGVTAEGPGPAPPNRSSPSQPGRGTRGRDRHPLLPPLHLCYVPSVRSATSSNLCRHTAPLPWSLLPARRDIPPLPLLVRSPTEPKTFRPRSAGRAPPSPFLPPSDFRSSFRPLTCEKPACRAFLNPSSTVRPSSCFLACVRSGRREADLRS